MLGAPVGAEGGCRCTQAEVGEGQAKGGRNEQVRHGRSGRGPGPGGSCVVPRDQQRPVYRPRPSPSLRFGPWWSTGPVVVFGITFWKRFLFWLLLFCGALFLCVWVFGLRVRACAHARAASMPGVHGGEKKSDGSHGTGVTDDVSRHARCWESVLFTTEPWLHTHLFKEAFFFKLVCVWVSGKWKRPNVLAC